MASCKERSRKGVSADEKRKRIESIFHETGEFYQLKDIEKLGPKRGVVSQSVKEVLMSLVDDGLVTMDKIGTSNYFWSYPSAAAQTKKNKLNEAENKYKKEMERKARLEALMEEAQVGREPSDERTQVLNALEEQQETTKALHAELKKYQDNDPVLFEAKEKGARIAKEAANRWTENIWEMKSYCVNNFGMERSMFDQQFGLKDDFDTIP
ncbi:meiotic nuclear division protein 1 [Mucor mucedo]|uniref:meiotic nuclear division protein 1 n=1 Tax=Mucor mucedo TaxID=29922 RepID=UPI002220DD82|nr:meiotic nuclear division protein 1 [Mucor mucedo]KAI7892426.1 meiotic nuclear division protein 1 [Mucor mucedo]